MKFDAVIFDLDGTLWHTKEAALYAWKKTLEKHPYITTPSSEETVKATMGKNLLELAEVFLQDQPMEKKLEIMQDAIIFTLEHVFASPSTVYSGIAQSVKELSKKLPLFIISDGPNEFLQSFYKMSGLFNYIKDSALLSAKKDKKANLKDLSFRHGLKNPLFVGDSQRDSEAAKANGIKFCFASYGYLTAQDFDYKISAPNELLEIIL